MTASPEWLLHDGDARVVLTPGQVVRAETRTWRGWFDRTELGGGLYVHLGALTVTERTTLDVARERGGGEPWVCAYGFVAGGGRLHLPGNAPIRLSTARGVLMLPHERRGSFDLPAGRDLRFFSVGISPQALVERLDGRVPAAIKPLLEARGGRSHLLAMPLAPMLQAMVSGLYTSPYAGPLLRLHREGVALLYLADMLAHAGGAHPRAGGALGAREEGLVREAHERLVADMRDPPGVSALAAQVGLSARRLALGFRALYGESQAQLLRRHRLDHAREILESAELPLKDVAWRVGYSHVNNFIAAFSAQFGLPPGRLRRRGRR